MFETDKEKKEFEFIGLAFTIAAFFYFLYAEAYGAILICILFVGFVNIVVDNKKYTFMQEYIEEFL